MPIGLAVPLQPFVLAFDCNERLLQKSETEVMQFDKQEEEIWREDCKDQESDRRPFTPGLEELAELKGLGIGVYLLLTMRRNHIVREATIPF
ncbi:hypothetical protein FOPE_03817 [Fonsecaea pedrosoi]|nr:hypothetical protein FOPE_03817 [Fonsecaea pedrosoi]